MDFPGGPVIRTACFHCRGNRFDPWLGNQDPTSRAAQPKKKNIYIYIYVCVCVCVCVSACVCVYYV